MAAIKEQLNDEEQELRRIYRWSFAIRFGFAATVWILVQISDIQFGDAGLYQQLGEEVGNDWLSGNSSPVLEQWRESGQAWGMIALIAVFYFITGGLGAMPLLLACYSAITAFAPVLTYRIARKLGVSPAGARRGAWLVLLSPSFAFWAALYKEGMIFVLLNLIAYQILLLQEKFNLRSLVIIGASLPALFGLRFYLAMMVAPIVLLSLLMGRAKQEGGGKLQTIDPVFFRQLLIVAIIVLVLVGVGFTEQVQKFLPTDSESFLTQIHNTRSDLANSAASGFLPDADLSTPEAALKFLPVGLAYFVTVPLPWQFGQLLQNLAIPETAYWLFLYPSILKGMIKGLRHNFQGSVLLIAITAAICCIYALLLGNIGTVYRMRSQAWLLWAVFAGWGWEEKHNRRQKTLESKNIKSKNAIKQKTNKR